MFSGVSLICFTFAVLCFFFHLHFKRKFWNYPTNFIVKNNECFFTAKKKSTSLEVVLPGSGEMRRLGSFFFALDIKEEETTESSDLNTKIAEECCRTTCQNFRLLRCQLSGDTGWLLHTVRKSVWKVTLLGNIFRTIINNSWLILHCFHQIISFLSRWNRHT